ncbi:hypothetical protein [Algoriphagus sediminis]|uniref:O-antigen ligase domain-containing protein n=1 Tax=Algoriphagus sediminis TaxID=3057113 RepID=A0ABT7YDV3_9BACT|nr:hypothetical protein [Algoriphagus sediminis]MDN3204673.1 hypothetical protein [Algoriphagus sediminis]
MKVFLTVLIVIFTGALGLYNFQSDAIFFGLHSYDLAIALLNIVFILLILMNPVFSNALFSTPFTFFTIIYFYVLGIVLFMPFRGDINIFMSFRVGRDFFILPLFYLLINDIIRNDNFSYYKNLFYFLAIFTSIQILLNSISPELVSDLFQEVRARERYKYEFQRNDFISKTMLFPHFGAIYIFFTIRNSNKNNIVNSLLLLLFLMAVGLQGFRSYLLVLSLLLLLYLVLQIQSKKVLRLLFWACLTFPVLLVFDFVWLNGQITNKFISIPLDFVSRSDEGSTTFGRIELDLIYTIPRFLEKPIFGWGFIHHNSGYGKEIGLLDTSIAGNRAFTLYSVDSGYLTLLNYFGIFGVLFILIFYIKFLLSPNFKYCRYILLFSFLLLLLTLPTHGSFYSDFGLVPFTFIMALSISRGLSLI